MTPSENLVGLAERVERQAEPWANLDCAIFATIHPEKFEGSAQTYARPDWTRNRADWIWLRDMGMPAYTSSLDAAMTLVPEGMRFYVDNGTLDAGSSHACAWTGTPPGISGGCKGAATPALALCAAALRSRSAQ